MMKRIAVLLTVYNRRDKTLYCLDRLYHQENMDNYKVDVFLTDDGSTDGTSEAVCTKYPKVHIIKGIILEPWHVRSVENCRKG